MSQNVFVSPYPYNGLSTSYLESGSVMWDNVCSVPATSNSPAPISQQPAFLPSSPMVFMNSSPGSYNFTEVHQPSPVASVQNGGMFVLVKPQPPQPMMMLIPAMPQPSSALPLPRDAPKGTEPRSICRHYMVGRCNRRKCRFLHPAPDQPPLPGVDGARHRYPIGMGLKWKDSYDSSVNDISASTSPMNSKSEMLFSSSVADSVLMDAFNRKN